MVSLDANILQADVSIPRVDVQQPACEGPTRVNIETHSVGLQITEIFATFNGERKRFIRGLRGRRVIWIVRKTLKPPA